MLFWSRSLNPTYNPDNSIVKASAAAPSVVATVLLGSADASFHDPEVSPDGTKLAYMRLVWNAHRLPDDKN